MNQHAYIAREAKCRHVTLAIVDSPEYQKDVAREIAKAVRMGMTVERVTVEKARAALGKSFGFKHAKDGKCSRRKEAR